MFADNLDNTTEGYLILNAALAILPQGAAQGSEVLPL